MTKEQVFKQKVSFVYGNLPFSRSETKEQVEKHLLERRGL